MWVVIASLPLWNNINLRSLHKIANVLSFVCRFESNGKRPISPNFLDQTVRPVHGVVHLPFVYWGWNYWENDCFCFSAYSMSIVFSSLPLAPSGRISRLLREQSLLDITYPENDPRAFYNNQMGRKMREVSKLKAWYYWSLRWFDNWVKTVYCLLQAAYFINRIIVIRFVFFCMKIISLLSLFSHCRTTKSLLQM